MYADADTSCTRPIDYWIPQDDWNDPTVHSVIGIEYADEGHGANGWCSFAPPPAA
jgi:mannosyltransferase OCH1-like enzyme